MSNAQRPDDIAGTSVPRHSHGFTDFAAHSHQELYNMLYASDPATVREAAAAWQSTGRMLADQAQQLKHRLVNFSQMWQGAAADEYKVMITDLANGLDKVGTGALAMNELMSASAEAVDRARAAMPAPQAVPDLDPQVVAAATAPAPAAQAQFSANQQQAQQAVLAHQAQVAAAQGAQAQAVQVMHQLATDYGSTEDSVPAAPESVGSGPAGVPADSTGVPLPGSQRTGVGLTDLGPAGVAADGSALSGTAPSASVPNSPLFGHMFTAGLAAASAAVSGRFGSVMPRLPSFLSSRTKKDGTSNAASSAAGVAARAAALRAAASARLAGAAGGLGGGAGGLGGGLGGAGFAAGGTSAPAAAAYPGLIGGNGVAGTAGIAAGQVAGAVAGAPGAAGTSAMPMMPMGGMAGAGAGDLGGRRIPPWLVETEDVWGESSAVSPPVIGED